MRKGFGNRINIEPSLLYDEEYYNGLVFQGYIKGLPRTVLSGGRYDKLLQRFGKKQPALGFALYFNELTELTAAKKEHDVDILLLYDDASQSRAGAAADRLVAEGNIVRVERQVPEGLRAKSIITVEEAEKEFGGAQC